MVCAGSMFAVLTASTAGSPAALTERLRSMHSSHKVCLGLAFAGLCTLTTIHAASAQNLTYTLSGVTFSDGATATGFFNFDPATQTFGSFALATTNGTDDMLTGHTYLSAQNSTYHQQATAFSFIDNSGVGPYHVLTLVAASSASAPGLYSLFPGVATAGTNQFYGSGELTPNDRLIVAGFLNVTNPAAVPEASTILSFGLLLALGLGGIKIAKRKKARAA